MSQQSREAATKVKALHRCACSHAAQHASWSLHALPAFKRQVPQSQQGSPPREAHMVGPPVAASGHVLDVMSKVALPPHSAAMAR